MNWNKLRTINLDYKIWGNLYWKFPHSAICPLITDLYTRRTLTLLYIGHLPNRVTDVNSLQLQFNPILHQFTGILLYSPWINAIGKFIDLVYFYYLILFRERFVLSKSEYLIPWKKFFPLLNFPLNSSPPPPWLFLQAGWQTRGEKLFFLAVARGKVREEG